MLWIAGRYYHMRRLLILLSLTAIALCLGNGGGSCASDNVSKRGILNVNFVQNVNDYAFINFIQEDRITLTPGIGQYLSPNPVWNSHVLDANGYPITHCASRCQTFIFGMSMPAGGDFGSNPGQFYCLQGLGSATLKFATRSLVPDTQKFTVLPPSLNRKCATRRGWSQDDCSGTQVHRGTTPAPETNSDSSVSWDVTDNGDGHGHPFGWCIAFASSLTRPAASLVITVVANNPHNITDFYLHKIALYESVDVADWQNGLVFRAAYKHPIVIEDPSAIRFMNWNAGVNATEMRFEDRATPDNEVGYAGIGQILSVPFIPYDRDATGVTQYKLTASSQTPPSMQHGEVASFRVNSSGTAAVGIRHGSNYAQTIIGVSVPKPGIIVIETGRGTAPSAHGFSAGDTIALGFFAPTSLANLDNYYATNIGYEDGTYCGTADTACFYFSHDTTELSGTICNSQTTCGATGCTVENDNCAYALEGVMLQVGSGNDRTSYPVVRQDGSTNFGYFTQVRVNSYQRVCFNKEVIGEVDHKGNPVYGAWVDCNNGNIGRAVPLEIQTEFINELNAMHPVYPINMWVNMPKMGLICSAYYSEPDCARGSDWPANAVKTIFEGANGYVGLAVGCPRCILFVEDANETWNTNQQNAGWFSYLGSLPGSPGHTGCGIHNDYQVYSTLHAQLVMNDIKNSGYAPPGKVKYLIGGSASWGAYSGVNYKRITGWNFPTNCWPQFVTGDPATHAPINEFDYFTIATYLGSSSRGVGNSIDKYMVTGTCPAPAVQTLPDQGCANQWAYDAATYGKSSQEARSDIAAWVNIIKTEPNDTSGTVPSIYMYETNWLPCLAELLSTGTFTNPSRADCGAPAYTPPPIDSGKAIVGYEGGIGMDTDSPVTLTSISCEQTTGVVRASTKNSGTTTANKFEKDDYIYISAVETSTGDDGYNAVFRVADTLDPFTFLFHVATCPTGMVINTGWVIEATKGRHAGSGYLWAIRQSNEWAVAQREFYEYFLTNPYLGMPGLYTVIACNSWTLACPDSYRMVGSSPAEGAGFYPAWFEMGNYNRKYPFLLKRDVDPASHDNGPAFLDHDQSTLQSG